LIEVGLHFGLKNLRSQNSLGQKNLEEDVITIALEDLELLLEGINVWTRFESVHFETVV